MGHNLTILFGGDDGAFGEKCNQRCDVGDLLSGTEGTEGRIPEVPIAQVPWPHVGVARGVEDRLLVRDRSSPPSRVIARSKCSGHNTGELLRVRRLKGVASEIEPLQEESQIRRSTPRASSSPSGPWSW